jgi:hypothetical protein
MCETMSYFTDLAPVGVGGRIYMTAESLTVGSSSLGKGTCLQVSERECVLLYRGF